jgi:dinuclear metal center YbgI/SA1388 family protein
MKIREIISCIESFAPLHVQESYDNSGLIIGSNENEIQSVLISIDITDEVIDEAIAKKANLIISHHPLIFNGLKKITGKTSIEQIVIKAIKNDISIYSCHTNLDSVTGGVSSKLSEKIGLVNCKILEPLSDELRKLSTFVPSDFAEKVRFALFEAGAGFIGNYDYCSFNVEGKGTFRASEKANPFVGNRGEIHYENEIKIEIIFPKFKQSNILKALNDSHPYEEVAYDIYLLDNKFENAGMGVIGDLPGEMEELAFISNLKKSLNLKTIRCTNLTGKAIKKVAVCGGAGFYLLKRAIECKADFFISADFKYHQFFEAENKIIIADIGHYESEQFTKEIIYDLLIKKFTTFAIYLSKVNTNPIHYI